MSEVTTLKQLMLDAARYRWVRVEFPKWVIAQEWGIDPSRISPEWCDAQIDERLDSE